MAAAGVLPQESLPRAGPALARRMDRHGAEAPCCVRAVCRLLWSCWAQSLSRCADCHFANPGSVSASHLAPLVRAVPRAQGHPGAHQPGESRASDQPAEDLRHLPLEDVRNAMKDPVRRRSLEAAAQQAEVPIIEATQAGHAFVFDQLDERVATARARLTALFERVSNPDLR